MESPVQKNILFNTVLPFVERISWPLAVLGFGLRSFQLSGGSILLMIGLANLAIVHHLGSFVPVSTTPQSPQSFAYEPVSAFPTESFASLALSKIGGIASAVTLIGILFKLLFWNGSASMLLVGVLSLAAVAVIQLTSNKLSRRVIIIACLGTIVWVIPNDTFVQQFYRNDLELTEAMRYHLHHPKDRVVAEKVRQLLRTQRSRLGTSH
jgi:hypothetical protein